VDHEPHSDYFTSQVQKHAEYQIQSRSVAELECGGDPAEIVQK